MDGCRTGQSGAAASGEIAERGRGDSPTYEGPNAGPNRADPLDGSVEDRRVVYLRVVRHHDRLQYVPGCSDGARGSGDAVQQGDRRGDGRRTEFQNAVGESSRNDRPATAAGRTGQRAFERDAGAGTANHAVFPPGGGQGDVGLRQTGTELRASDGGAQLHFGDARVDVEA